MGKSEFSVGICTVAESEQEPSHPSDVLGDAWLIFLDVPQERSFDFGMVLPFT